jgi:hypothetical protein
MKSEENIQSAFFNGLLQSFEVVRPQGQIVRAFSILTGGQMKTRSRILVALAAIAALAPIQAEAKGCIKGAIVGGIAGHLVGHGKLGAAAGCVVGHHEANKPAPTPEGQPAIPAK